MSKQKLFVDFDLTIADSIKAFTDYYNCLYKTYPDFKPANPDKITSYDFKCICPLMPNSEKVFGKELFFNFLELMPDAYGILKKLNDKYKIIIVSIGNPMNISKKILWIEKYLPFIKDCILITNEGCKMNKSVVNMKDSIFIDDIPSNLKSTNAERKILFGKIYPWNKGWEGEHIPNWKEIENKLL